MNQYPPYQQPVAYVYPGTYMTDYFAPNKRASVMMFINGALMLLCGIGCGVMTLLPLNDALMENPELQSQLAGLGDPAAIMSMVLLVFGAIGFVLGVLNIGLGFPTRNGSATAAVLGAVLAGLVVLMLLLNILTSLVSGRGAETIVGALVLAVPIILSAIQVFLCIGAARNVSAVNAIRAQYEHQWHAYHQQYQPNYPNPHAGHAPYPPMYPGYPAESGYASQSHPATDAGGAQPGTQSPGPSLSDQSTNPSDRRPSDAGKSE